MQNGHRVPLSEELTLLVGISRSLGRVEGRLMEGDRRMDKQDRILMDTASRVRRVEARLDAKGFSSMLRELQETLKLLWPLLLLLTAIASAAGVHIPDWVREFAEHSKTE